MANPSEKSDPSVQCAQRISALANELCQSGIPAGAVCGALIGSGIELALRGGATPAKIRELTETLIGNVMQAMATESALKAMQATQEPR